MKRTLVCILSIACLALQLVAREAAAKTSKARKAATSAASAAALPSRDGVLIKGLLPNGLRLVLWYDPSLDMEEACLAVGVGSALDMEHKQGAAALVAEMLAPRRPGLVPADPSEPRVLDVVTDEDGASFEMASPADQFGPALEAFGHRLARFDFTESEFEEARKRALSRFEVHRPWSSSDLLLRTALYHQYGYHHAPLGSPETLPNITSEICHGYFRQYYRPNNAVLVLTGPLSPSDAQRVASRAFADWAYGYIPPGNPNEPPPLETSVTSFIGGAEGVGQVLAGAVVPHLGLADRAALETWLATFATYEGDSPASSAVPRRGRLDRHKLCDEVRFSWSVPDTELEASLLGWQAGLRLAELPGLESEMERSVEAAVNHLTQARRWTSEAARATLYGWTVDTPDDIQAAASLLDATRVRETVRRLLRAERWAAVASGPPGSLRPSLVLGKQP